MNNTDNTTTLPRAQVIRNRWMLVGLFAVFLLPVVVAYLGYFGGWFSGIGTANRGELWTPVQALSAFQLQRDNVVVDDKTNDQKWYLVLVRAEDQCNEICALQLYTQNSVWVSLNKHQDRVRLALVTPGQFKLEPSVERWQGLFDGALIHGNDTTRTLDDQYFYLVDPMANIVLRYRAPSTKEEAQQRFKDIKADLDKLMKFSRIG